LRKYIRWILRFWKPHRLHIAVLVVFTLVSSAVALAFPLVFRYLLDNVHQVLGTPHSADFTNVLLILAALALARFVAGLYPGARAWLNSKIGLSVRDEVFESVMDKDHRFFNSFRPGDLTTRLTDDIVDYPRIAWFSCSAIFRALESSSRLVFCLGVMLFMSWELTLISLVPLPLMLFIFYRVEHRLGEKVEQSRKTTSHTNDLLDSTFAGIPIVKAYCAEKGQTGRLRRLLNRRLEIDLGLTKLMMIVHGLYSVIGQVGKVTVMFVGGLFVISGRIGLGEFYAFYVYLDMLLAPMMDIPNLFVTSRQAFVSIDREQEILDYPARPAAEGTLDPGPVRSVEFRNAGFRHGGGGGVDSLDLVVDRPGVIALVGEVGCGKSTVLKMLSRILPCETGTILLNGIPLEEVSESALIRELGYVPQESRLFSESVEENVRLGRDIPGDRVATALRVAGLDGSELRKGSETLLGQGGSGVSGGQKQRIAIARALAGSPSLLLLDDCTAALDAEKEETFWRELRRERKDAMVFVISHREATVRQSDRVVFIHEGEVVDVDTHENLTRSSELYRLVLAAEMD
jgi:ATP-binding cassette subfamily B protein